MIDITTTFTAVRGELIVKREQDTTGYLEQNKRELAEAPSWRPYSGRSSLRKVASVPMIVVEQMMKEGINPLSNDPEMQRKFYQKLNSNEYRHLRTYPGKIGPRK